MLGVDSSLEKCTVGSCTVLHVISEDLFTWLSSLLAVSPELRIHALEKVRGREAVGNGQCRF